ncbi:hypothetical protein M885DRAFT_624827 [Pelagophyceae sp. CCMP2097]|nr:hypothetical protein M885DRAFT_624827 [Pelagophyceae sp. CCMP2097]
MTARGRKIEMLEFDTGGETVDAKVRAALALHGIAAETQPTDRKLGAGERVHEVLNCGTRAALLGGAPNAGIQDWPWARAWMVSVLNLAAPEDSSRLPPWRAVFPNVAPDVTAWLPFGCQIVAIDSARSKGLANRAITGTYLGADPSSGPQAIAFRTPDGSIRHTTSFKYIGAPGDHCSLPECGAHIVDFTAQHNAFETALSPSSTPFTGGDGPLRRTTPARAPPGAGAKKGGSWAVL